MPGGLFRRRPIEHVQTTVIGSDAEYHVARYAVVVGEERATETSPPQARQRDRVRHRRVRHHRVYGTECLDFVRLQAIVRTVACEQRDREERATTALDPHRFHAATIEDDFGTAFQRNE